MQSTEDLTIFVQNLLQQMQSRFSTMSDAIIGRSAPAPPCRRSLAAPRIAPRRRALSKLRRPNCAAAACLLPAPLLHCAAAPARLAHRAAARRRAVDEMGHRIDELENSIGELMSQAGIEEEAAAEGAAPASAEVAAS